MNQATIAGDRPAIIGTLAYGAATRAAISIEGVDASQLLDYTRELEATAREFADRQRDGTAGIRPPVLAFAWLMEHKLRKHDDDRGAHGWKDAHPDRLLAQLHDEAGELEDALAEWYRPQGMNLPEAARLLGLEAADVGNMAMMVADRAGGLEGAGPGQPHKRAQRLHQGHRMLGRLRRLIERLEVDGVTPHARIAWLRSDEKALQWMVRQLDPHGEFREPLATRTLEGDGSGQALPPIDADQLAQERTAAGTPAFSGAK